MVGVRVQCVCFNCASRFECIGCVKGCYSCPVNMHARVCKVKAPPEVKSYDFHGGKEAKL